MLDLADVGPLVDAAGPGQVEVVRRREVVHLDRVRPGRDPRHAPAVGVEDADLLARPDVKMKSGICGGGGGGGGGVGAEAAGGAAEAGGAGGGGLVAAIRVGTPPGVGVLVGGHS